MANLANYSNSPSFFTHFYYFYNIPYVNGLQFAQVFSTKLSTVIIHQTFYRQRFCYMASHLCHYTASYSVTCVIVLLDKEIGLTVTTSVIYSDALVIALLNKGQEIINRVNIMYALKVSQQSCLACSINSFI